MKRTKKHGLNFCIIEDENGYTKKEIFNAYLNHVKNIKSKCINVYNDILSISTLSDDKTYKFVIKKRDGNLSRKINLDGKRYSPVFISKVIMYVSEKKRRFLLWWK